MARKAARKKLPRRVFIKAAHLQKKEGMKRDQAIAVAASMDRRGELTEEGKLKKTARKKKASKRKK